MTSAADAGSIRIELGLDGTGRVTDARILNHRPVEACRILRGLAPEDAVRLVRSLYSICGMAQGITAARALEAASGKNRIGNVEALRELMVLAEAAQSHAWRWCIDAPGALASPPEMLPLAAVRKTVSELAGLVGEEPFKVGGRGQTLPAGLSSLVAKLAAQLRIAVAPGIKAVRETWYDINSTETAFSGCRWIVPANSDLIRPLAVYDSFARSPHIDNQPIEVSPRVGEADGSSFQDRLAAQAETAEAVAAALEAFDATPPEPCTVLIGDGAGASAMTARGPLAHWVRLHDGIITDYRTVAPTEWHFQENGPVSRAFVGARLGDVPDVAANLIALGFDACVPVKIVTREMADA